jgi:hypothetical protein
MRWPISSLLLVAGACASTRGASSTPATGRVGPARATPATPGNVDTCPYAQMPPVGQLFGARSQSNRPPYFVMPPKPTSAPARLDVRIPDQPSLAAEERALREDRIRHPWRPDWSLDIVLTNESDRPLWVNARLRDGPPVLNDVGDAEIALDVVGPPDAPPYDCYVHGRRTKDSDYVVLKPGERIESHSQIRCLLQRAGTYTAYISYRDSNPHPPPPPAEVEYLSETIVAPTVCFRVLDQLPGLDDHRRTRQD